MSNNNLRLLFKLFEGMRKSNREAYKNKSRELKVLLDYCFELENRLAKLESFIHNYHLMRGNVGKKDFAPGTEAAQEVSK